MRFLRIIFPAILVCCLAVSPAFAGQFDDGQAAYDQQDYKTAFKLWQPLAELGDANAQYKLGMMYDYGYGVRKSVVQAVDWYRRAAVQGNAAAQRHYEADNFAFDMGLPEVAQAKASDRIAPSVAAGASEKIPEKEAQQAAAIEPAAGSATVLQPPIPFTVATPPAPEQPPAVDAATVQTLTRLAEQGVAEAQRDLGILYQLGNGVPQDYGQATIWFTKASAQGDEEAQQRLSELYAGRGLAAPQNNADVQTNAAIQSNVVMQKDQPSPAPADDNSPPVRAEHAPPPVESRQHGQPSPIPAAQTQSSDAAAPRQQISLATQQGFDLTAEVSQYRYNEINDSAPFVAQTGYKSGIEAGYTKVLIDAWFMRGEGRYARGPIDYSSASGVAHSQPDNTWELRGFGGTDYIIDGYDMSPYVGFGFRYLYNDARGGTSISPGQFGYRRESRYRYVPIGVINRFRLTDQSLLATNLEGDVLTGGTQKSFLSDATSAVPIGGDVLNHQRQGYGGRGSALYETSGWSVGPWFSYWHIRASDIVPIPNDPPEGLMEPNNSTTEFGFKIVKNFW